MQLQSAVNTKAKLFLTRQQKKKDPDINVLAKNRQMHDSNNQRQRAAQESTLCPSQPAEHKLIVERGDDYSMSGVKKKHCL